MRLRHLRYFLAAAEERHLSRAAAELRMAQPALSRQIHDLERELGVPLLERHPRGVTPTAAGEALARGSTELICDIASALDRAEGAATGQTGRVVIGLPRVALVRGLAAWLDRALRERHPDITVIVYEIDGVQEWDLVASGELDLAVGASPLPGSGLLTEPLWEDVVNRALIPATHELATRERVLAAELSSLPFFLPPRGFLAQFAKTAMAQLTAAGLRSPLLALDTGLAGAQLMVAAGRGWGLMSEAMAQAARPSGTAAPVLEGLRIPVPFDIAWRRNERRQVARVVIELALEFARGTPGSRVRDTPALPPALPIRAARRRKPGSTPIELEFRHLRALLEVAATQSIGRAAEQLGLTQPALSRQLQELEKSLGFALLHRGARGVTLTAGGTALASECPALLGSLERLTRETTRARRGMEGQCVIGSINTVATSDLLAFVLTHCAERHPQLNTVIDEITSPQQPAALRQGRIDVALMHALPVPGTDRFSRERVHADHVEAALFSTSHPLAGRADVTAADLTTVPFVWMSRAYQPQLYDLFISSLAAIGLDPLIDTVYDGLATVYTSVAHGLGWCLASRTTLGRPPAGTVGVRIKGLDIPWGLDLVWRKDEPSAAVHAVIEAFRAARARKPKRARGARGNVKS